MISMLNHVKPHQIIYSYTIWFDWDCIHHGNLYLPTGFGDQDAWGMTAWVSDCTIASYGSFQETERGSLKLSKSWNTILWIYRYGQLELPTYQKASPISKG